ncbi:cell division cycle 25 homolog d [Salvelinus sp. IW2-2015]|uniref:cell division cycle 25 homolog d n=1 Tax=Salvelinus sp. IW2-2015 TaxID=2691554 RepID=UPI000CDF7EDA|nr:M-phase inducer phosphatase 3 [Salvelinus alpinus]
MEDHTLTGDYSKTLLLPVERVEHQDLHCISAQTVASLLRGQYSGTVGDFLIIDCRYPYEYHGGHIRGADTLHTEAQIQGLYSSSLPSTSSPPGAELPPATWTGSRSRCQWYFHGWSANRGPAHSHIHQEVYHSTRTGVTMEGSSPRK